MENKQWMESMEQVHYLFLEIQSPWLGPFTCSNSSGIRKKIKWKAPEGKKKNADGRKEEELQEKEAAFTFLFSFPLVRACLSP